MFSAVLKSVEYYDRVHMVALLRDTLWVNVCA